MENIERYLISVSWSFEIMARTPKPSGSKNKSKNTTDYDRQKPTIDPVNSIIIACEDTASSKTYLNLILDELKKSKKISKSSFAFAKHSNTHPSGVLADLLEHKTRECNTYEDFNHKWIVIDRDKQWSHGCGHSEDDFDKALNDAKNYGVQVAYSNDSFELWYLLHFVDYSAAVSRHQLNKDLLARPELASIASMGIKSSGFNEALYPILKPLECNAIKRAVLLLKSQQELASEPKNANPSTTIHHLVCLLRKIGWESGGVVCECNSEGENCYYEMVLKDFFEGQ